MVRFGPITETRRRPTEHVTPVLQSLH